MPLWQRSVPNGKGRQAAQRAAQPPSEPTSPFFVPQRHKQNYHPTRTPPTRSAPHHHPYPRSQERSKTAPVAQFRRKNGRLRTPPAQGGSPCLLRSLLTYILSTPALITLFTKQTPDRFSDHSVELGFGFCLNTGNCTVDKIHSATFTVSFPILHLRCKMNSPFRPRFQNGRTRRTPPSLQVTICFPV